MEIETKMIHVDTFYTIGRAYFCKTCHFKRLSEKWNAIDAPLKQCNFIVTSLKRTQRHHFNLSSNLEI